MYLYLFQGLTISGAIKYAVEQINNCSSILPDVELDFVYNDTLGDALQSNAILVDHICNDVAAFIGKFQRFFKMRGTSNSSLCRLEVDLNSICSLFNFFKFLNL